jgi:cyclopropane fatty-acyl-phospholipid synthase-like methyltransferase
MDLDLYNATYDFVCASISKENPKLLELGCGPGNITKYLLAKRPDFNILGIDISENMLELAKKNNPKAKFAEMDIRQIDGLNTRFDGLICGFCVPYLSKKDVEKLIRDAHKLLNEDGLIYLSFVEGDPENSGFQTGSNGDRSYFYFHQAHDLNLQLQKGPFENIKAFSIKYSRSASEVEMHKVLVARKIKCSSNHGNNKGC